jgi:hypothetical protein
MSGQESQNRQARSLLGRTLPFVENHVKQQSEGERLEPKDNKQ